mgnify:CR=1 FL=1
MGQGGWLEERAGAPSSSTSATRGHTGLLAVFSARSALLTPIGLELATRESHASSFRQPSLIARLAQSPLEPLTAIIRQGSGLIVGYLLNEWLPIWL